MLFVALLLASAVSPTTPPSPSAAAPSVTGRWLVEKKDAVIEIYDAGGGVLEGKVVEGREPARLDTKNPDAALRSRRLVGSVIMAGMKADGPGRWSGGTIYDPDTGNTYRCKMTLDGDVLDLRGYLGISLFGRTARWTRAEEKQPPAM